MTAATIDLLPEYPAYRLIGFEGSVADVPAADGDYRPRWDENQDVIRYPSARVRVKGGRALYTQVSNRDGALDARGMVELSRLESRDSRGIRVIARLVDEDTPLEVVVLDHESERA